MKLQRVDLRFFRSFNFDFERRAGDSKPQSWEDGDPWYPFVRVPVEPDITAIVGANEAGKSQLLAAVEAALTGQPILREDFCRYSEEYSVQEGRMRLPEFGAAFSMGDDESISGVAVLAGVTNFALYRPGSAPPFLVVDGERRAIPATQLKRLEQALPTVFRLKTGVAIPDSVSIPQLAGARPARLHNRQRRTSMLTRLMGKASPDEASVGEIVLPALAPFGDDLQAIEAERRRQDEFDLAQLLLVKAAKIDPKAFTELEAAVISGREGQIEAIVGAMNRAIRDNLNVQRWWTQDVDFDLLLEAREHELAFTIRDKTGSTYSFNERSQGLRFFLSYYVQLSAHRADQVRPDILLLDEPDAFLSSVGQQDLLRILQEYAEPEDGSAGSQVVYVTHSPFLIDKNAPHRIRVLDKGAEDEGTRVVRDAANNRYEPLRSSLGEYVAETAFIGGQNLFVEGPADQVLIAGLASHLARQEATALTLDLNRVTIVAAGGADGIPYMVYLARGRDTIKPPCVALLDGDEAGRRAEKILKRGEARKKRVLGDDFIVRLDRWAEDSGLIFDDGVTVEEIEDLLPAAIVHRASINHLARFRGLEKADSDAFTLDALKGRIEREGHVWEALKNAYSDAFPDEHIEKVGLAREVVALLGVDKEAPGAEALRTRFASLLLHLSSVLDAAALEEARSRSNDRVKRAVSNFSKSHTRGISRRSAQRLLAELSDAFEHSDWAEEAMAEIRNIRERYAVDSPASPAIADFVGFQKDVEALGGKEKREYQDDAARDPSAALRAADGAVMKA